jgi:hypothetical protein
MDNQFQAQGPVYPIVERRTFPFDHQPMPPEIAKAIVQVMGKVREVEKGGKNQFHNYRYATVADMMILLQPALADAGLVITQHMTAHNEDTGGNQICEFQFVISHVSGKSWVYPGIWPGVAADRARGVLQDKWFNKAATAAEKYFLLKLFRIPTVDEASEPLNDGDVDREPQQDQKPPTGRKTKAAAPTTTDNPFVEKAKKLRADMVEDAGKGGDPDEFWKTRAADLTEIEKGSKNTFDYLVKVREDLKKRRAEAA